jgi:hypothetical protein
MAESATCINCDRRIPPEFDACEPCVMGPYADADAIDRADEESWLLGRFAR